MMISFKESRDLGYHIHVKFHSQHLTGSRFMSGEMRGGLLHTQAI